MAEYSYQLQDLARGTPLADLPLSCTQGLPRVMSGDASATFTLDIGDPRVQNLAPIVATQPGRTALFVLRDGQPVWAGIIWGRPSYRAATSTLTITATTVESYWRRRFWAGSRTYTNIDQLAIAAGMWLGIRPVKASTQWIRSDGSSTTQAYAYNATDSDGALVPINVLPFNIRGPYRYDGIADSVIYQGSASTARTITYDPGKNVYDALVELSQLDGGFEWTCDPTRFSDNTLGWTLRCGSPQIGRTEDVTGVQFEFNQGQIRTSGRLTVGAGSNILDYDYSDDATNSAIRSVVTGQEESGAIPTHVAGELALLRQGYPLLEIGPNYSDTASTALDAKSFGDLADAPLPAQLTTWTVRADGDFGFGTAQMGDRAVFAVSDLFTPRQADGFPGRMSVERIVGWTLIPQERGQPERWQLTTNPVTQPSAKLPRSEAKRLELIDRRLRALSTSSRVGKTKTYGSVANTASVGLPAPTSSTPGNWAEVSDISFVKQGDYLTAYEYFSGSTASGTPVSWAVRIVGFDGRVLSSIGEYNATNSRTANYWWSQFSLDAYSYGDLINATLQARVNAYPPISGFDTFALSLQYVVSGLPYHD